MFWACNCGKISDNSNFTQSTQLLRSTFCDLGHLFWGGWFRWLLRAYSTQVFLYLSEPGVGSDTPRISTNCTELWLLVVTNHTANLLFQFEDPFLFLHHCFVAAKSVFALRFSYRTLGLRKATSQRYLLGFDNGFATKRNPSYFPLKILVV